MSVWIARTPGTLSDVPVGLWKIVSDGRQGFELKGAELIDFVRGSIYALLDAGAKPVRGVGKPNQWELQVQYGSSKPEIVEAVIREWLAQGAPTPKPWTGLAFGLPESYLPRKGH